MYIFCVLYFGSSTHSVFEIVHAIAHHSAPTVSPDQSTDLGIAVRYHPKQYIR